jgi:dTDP-4-dehydrorhamnose reductase
VLAAACAERGIHFTIFSSDLVFDGARDTPYHEEHAPAPLGIYGASKWQAERLAAAAHPDVLAIRTAAFFSPHDPHNFAHAVEHVLRGGGDFHASPGHVVSPTYVPDLVRACLDLVIDRERGVWHLANRGAASWFDFGVQVADALALDRTRIRPADPARLGWRAPRPAYAALGSGRGLLLPALDDAVARYAAARAA